MHCPTRGHDDQDPTAVRLPRALPRKVERQQVARGDPAGAFYIWYERALADGRMKPGQRLATAGKLVSQGRVVDGPFAETKELVGGYWFIVAASLEEAAAIAAENPCLACGLSMEVRPVELQRASAFVLSNETPLEGV
jgi:hypothetical protein